MPTHIRSSFDVTRAFVALSALGVVALDAALSFAPVADAARPILVRDMCAETSGGGGNMECNSSEDLLVRPKYSDGTCGDWVCCPPNGDGTYNCNAGSSPSGTQLNNAVIGSAVGSRATTRSPGSRVTPTARAPRATRRTQRVN